MTDLPTATGAHRLHADLAGRGPLRLRRCQGCGELHHPPRVVCPACGATTFVLIAASGKGTVYSTTVVRRPARDGGDHVVCLVDLAEGPRLMSRVDGLAPQDVRIGLHVAATWADGPDGTPVLAFVPDTAAAERTPATAGVATQPEIAP